MPYKKPDALTVPPKAVFTDELDLQKQLRLPRRQEGQRQTQKTRRDLGKRNDKQVEILSGLAGATKSCWNDPRTSN